MQWLAQAGHACQILTTARVEGAVEFSIEDHLTALGASVSRRPARAGRRQTGTDCAVVDYDVGGVPVTLLRTRHNDERTPDPAEGRQLFDLFIDSLDAAAPDVVIACNGHPAILSALAGARRRGIATAFGVRGYGYYDPGYFADVDHVFTCSYFLSRFYRERMGLFSTPLEPPIAWSTVVAPDDARGFVTFVHPALHKGVLFFGRLAAVLASRRPDIPVLVVQSGRTAGVLNAIPGIDFSGAPQIMAAPPVATPAEYFALTRLLLVPSVWPEPFGRVAAEAMINGIPPIVSDRGALPDVVRGESGDGGWVLPLPGWMTPETTRVPDEADVEPWFTAVCELWDDAVRYAAFSERGKRIALDRYSEAISRRLHVEYFTRLTAGGTPLPCGPSASSGGAS
jgi:glycosyltransferase involved in cell wall biosynthesis